MNRRTALRYFAISGAAAMLLPACVRDERKVSVALNNLQITPDDEDVLAAFAATLIPATDKPGAKETGSDIFTFVMVDDCLAKEKKEEFLKGLRAFNASAPVPGKKKFLDASPEDRQKTLELLHSGEEGIDSSVAAFYPIARRFVIQGYTSSPYFMTEVKPYKLVPGPIYKGCVPLTTT